MKTFAEFERVYHRTPVRVIDLDNAPGVLFLNGADSALTITGLKSMMHQPNTENGWFDLTLSGPDGTSLFLKNAVLTSSSTMHGGETGKKTHNAEVFPNFVIENSQHLSEGMTTTIRFTLPNLRNFFYYRYVEMIDPSQDIDGKTVAQIISQAKNLGRVDVFDPHIIYVAHQFPEFFSFRVGEKTYSVSAGGSETFGMHKFAFEQFPIASITFDKPVDVITAIEAAWSWRRLFSQQAVAPYTFETIALSGQHDHSHCPVYMPNEPHMREPSDDYYRIGPAHICFTQWSERNEAAASHRAWIESDTSRQIFRARVDRVIKSRSRRSDPRDISDLASAIESLPEFGGTKSLRNAALSEMARVASAAAEKHGFEIREDRIRGVLGNLGRPSLSERIKSMCQSAGVALEQAAVLAKKSSDLRNRIAHGKSSPDQVMAVAPSIVDALLCACINFDLVTSGFCQRTSANARTIPTWRFDDAMNMLS